MPKNQPIQLPIKYYSSVFSKKVDWLWYPYIPYGKITVVQGDPGDGKTTLVLNLAALLSTGTQMPITKQPSLKGTVLYQSAEDGVEDTLKPRLVSADADCFRIAFIDDSKHSLSLDSPYLENAILETKASMLVLDPLQAYLGESGEMNRADGIRPMLKKLAAVANRTKCAVIIIGHMNKSSGLKGLYQGLGSIDIAATARSVLLVGCIKSNPKIRVMTHLKSSLAKEGASVAFEINDKSGIRWLGEYEITADELLTGTTILDESGKVSSAELLIRCLLSGGAKLCSQIYTASKAENIGKRTVDTAKKNLGVKSQKRPDGWYWCLPDNKQGEGQQL
jgi:archaellum biogenesis ATPase FlaH